MASFEALLRWQRADGTLLAPGDFVAIAEETGTIVPIGAWVIETACRKIAAWTLDGIDEPSLSINVSALQFRHGALLHDLERALTRTGADPTRLTLEITESVLVADNDDVIGQLETIRRLGVRIAIDDFGTGYSGFSYLHRLPVDIIKIDQSLTVDLGSDPAAGIVVAAIIDLAHALGFQVIAEGAETARAGGPAARARMRPDPGLLLRAPRTGGAGRPHRPQRPLPAGHRSGAVRTACLARLAVSGCRATQDLPRLRDTPAADPASVLVE